MAGWKSVQLGAKSKEPTQKVKRRFSRCPPFGCPKPAEHPNPSVRVASEEKCAANLMDRQNVQCAAGDQDDGIIRQCFGLPRASVCDNQEMQT